MNAAARALTEGTFSTVSNRLLFLTRQSIGTVLLVIAVLASAVAVVYLQAQDRELFCEYQSLQQARDELKIEWGQLELEQNTWACPTRIQNVASQQLGMALPAPKDIVLVTTAAA